MVDRILWDGESEAVWEAENYARVYRECVTEEVLAHRLVERREAKGRRLDPIDLTVLLWEKQRADAARDAAAESEGESHESHPPRRVGREPTGS